MQIKRIVSLIAAALLSNAIAVQAGAENYKWDQVAMGGGGYVTGVVPSKTERGLVYVRTDVGGAYRWDQSRSRWVSMMDWVSESEMGLLGIESLAVDPNNSANVYMLAGTSYFNNGKTTILRSTDHGKTFTVTDVTTQFKAHGNGMGRGSGEKLQVDPGSSNVLYAGTRRNGLFKSVDSGATWNKMAAFEVTSTPNDNGVSFVLLDPTSVENGVAQRMFVGVSRFDSVGPNLYFSYDGGESFIPVEGGPTGLMPQRAVMTPDGMLYITYANGAGPHPGTGEALDKGQVWEYDAAGGNWTNITPAGIGNAFGGISIDPNNPKRLVASTSNTWRLQHGSAYGERIYLSNDAGRNWVDVVARGFELDTKGVSWIGGAAIHWAGSIEFDPFDTKNVWVTSGNGLFKTSNIDATKSTWAFDVAGLEETVPLNAASVEGRPLVSAIGDYDGFIHNDPSVYGPMHSPLMGTTTGLAIASLDSRIMARAGNSIYYTSDAGTSWTKAASMNGSKGQLALSADGAVLLHSPENLTTTYRSVNFGTTWTPVTGLDTNSARPVGDPVNPAKFYAYDSANGKMMVSIDGGVSFTAKASLNVGGSKVIRTVPGREGDLWVCLSGSGLAHSTDSGATFTKIAGVAECGAVGFGKAAPGVDYPTMYMWGKVGTTRGMLRSVDKGVTWVRVNDDAHEYGGPGNGQFVIGDMNTYGRVYMSTAGLGLVYGSTDAMGDVAVVPVAATLPPGPAQPVNKCEYVVTAAWSGGYNAAVKITNNRSTTINGWTVNWTYTDGSVVWGFWNAAVSGTSPNYTATANQSWNTNIAPGATVEFGMTVGGSAIPVVTGDVCK